MGIKLLKFIIIEHAFAAMLKSCATTDMKDVEGLFQNLSKDRIAVKVFYRTLRTPREARVDVFY